MSKVRKFPTAHKRNPTITEQERARLEAAGLDPIGPVPAPERLTDEALTSSLHQVLERRGYQRFFYHSHQYPLSHWWDIQNHLNNLQMDLEKIFGQQIFVELVSMHQITHNEKPWLQSFFKIGPIPYPHVPWRETTLVR